MPIFRQPGILWDREKSVTFDILGMQIKIDNKTVPGASPGEKTAECQQFSPDTMLKFIAKIAHAAAVAELGIDGFSPLLPDIILGKSPFISYLVGSATRKYGTTSNLYEITLCLRRRYVVAIVHLFSTYLRYPFVAVVGRPREDLARLHTSALMRSAIAIK